jgi:DNA-binding MarR family transcriptional regulator
VTTTTARGASATILEREWGRLRRGQLLSQLRHGDDESERPLQLELLREVAAAGELRASELAARVYVTRASISRYVTEMRRSGLLATRPDPADGRATLLSVTPRGRQALARRERRRVRALAELCATWNDEDVATLTDLLHRLNDGIERSLRAERR